jgi:hypothetical protein
MCCCERYGAAGVRVLLGFKVSSVLICDLAQILSLGVAGGIDAIG